MAWGRSKKSDAPKWSQDEYHKEFASQIREQIKAGLRRGRNRGSPARRNSRRTSPARGRTEAGTRSTWAWRKPRRGTPITDGVPTSDQGAWRTGP